MACWLALLLSLPKAVATGTCAFDVHGKYLSPDFPEHTFGKVRATTGVINGPLPVQPNTPEPQYDYDVTGYKKNFEKLGLSWVRFQDLGMTQGGTSLSQTFTAWPLNNADLKAADVTQLVSNSSNFNFTSVDINVRAAIAVGARLDFRLGDSHQIASLLQEGMPIPVGDRTVTFPKAWGFPTNIETDEGLNLWSAVAVEVAKRVWKLVGENKDKVAFDLLTETTDGNCFWPSSAERYAKLYSMVMPQIKSTFGNGVQCIGANTMSPTKPGANGDDPWIVRFLKECGKMGYQKCPLDVIAFHVFSPKATRLIPENAKWVMDQTGQHLSTFKTLPGLAMTAWGFHGSGMYDYNEQPEGAAIMTNGLIAIENAPIDFMIYYKWAGINCKSLKSPCLVVNEPGTLKPTAVPFMFQSLMLKAGTSRISADCSGANAIAVRSDDNRTIAAMIAPLNENADDVGNMTIAPHNVKIENMPCASKSATLTVEYVDSGLAGDNSAITKNIQVSGKLGDDSLFVADGASEPYELKSTELAFSSLLVMSCDSHSGFLVV